MILIRDVNSPVCTMGYFKGLSEHIFTLERPWVPYDEVQYSGNPPPCGRKGVSCVPPGIYRLERHMSEAHPDTFALVNPDLWVYHYEGDVPEDQKGFARTTVLIHPANYVTELRGCIAPGMWKQGNNVYSSRRAFEVLLPLLKMSVWMEIADA